MKQILSILLCVLLLFSLAGCGNNTEEPSESTTESTAPEGTVTSQFPKADSRGLKYEINEDGISCTVTGLGTCKDTAVSIGSQIDGYTVTAIGDHAFFSCTELTGVSIPDSVTSIGAYAFYGCTGLTEVLLGEGLVTISQYAFAYCSGILTVTIPQTVTQIDGWAFYYCPSLQSVHIHDISAWLQIHFASVYANPLRYAGELYVNDVLLTALTVPEEITVIGAWTFEGSTSLERVSLHENVTEIGDRAFRDCEKLTRIDYAGTKDMWKAIVKSSTWNASMEDHAIYCSDGKIIG